MDLKYNNEKYSVELKENSGIISTVINEESKDYQVRNIASNIFSFFQNNTYKNVYTAEDNGHFYVAFDGDNYVFDKIKEEEKSFGNSDNENSGNRQEVLPPMPGSIVKVLVETGQKVTEGEALVIVEAMKMETSLYSSIDGEVKEINVKAGEQVDSDKILMVLEKI